MSTFDRGLEDLAFITKRFAGLIEMGERIKEAQVLVNQTEELKKTVADHSAELDKSKKAITKAKSDLKAVQDVMAQAEKDAQISVSKRDQARSEYDNAVIAQKRKQDELAKDLEAFRKDLLHQIDVEAENKKVALQREIAAQETKLADVKKAIENFKSKLG